ncbi:hypothetical protein ASF79_08420 [Agreia sp. Leaf335]|nr:hypothetical protein ASE64_11825 [Agreia sp. Leaf210]KQR22282.1 hypothetical protein ASF79_08420 [Agreia sp. Leaf335]
MGITLGTTVVGLAAALPYMMGPATAAMVPNARTDAETPSAMLAILFMIRPWCLVGEGPDNQAQVILAWEPPESSL